MTTLEQARDQLIGTFRTAWLADPTSASVPLEYDDVHADTDATPDAATRRPPYGRVAVRNLVGQQETLGGINSRRFLNTCAFALDFFTEPGDGNKLSDRLANVAKRILRQVQSVNGVWCIGDVASNEIGIDGGMFRTRVTGTFQYQERA